MYPTIAPTSGGGGSGCEGGAGGGLGGAGGDGGAGGGGFFSQSRMQRLRPRSKLQKKSLQNVPGQWLQKNWSSPGIAVHVAHGMSEQSFAVVTAMPTKIGNMRHIAEK